MALTITHSQVAGTGVDPDATIDGADWDANHSISGSIAASEVTSGAELSKTDDTNVTLTLGGTPTTALLKATSLTLGWTGTLAASRGGTGISSLGTGVATALGVNVGSAGAFVTFNGALGTPSSGTLTNCTGLPVAGGGTGAATFTAGAPLLGNGTSAVTVPVYSAGTNGLPLVSNATGSPAAFQQISTAAIVGTSSNNDAAAGSVGEFMISGGATLTSATVTMTIATPCVVTWTSTPMTNNAAIRFTTTGALPTGVTAGTTYYAANVSTNTFNIATSIANAIAGTYVDTSGTQSGTHTGINSSLITSGTGNTKDICGLSLTAGDWDVNAAVFHDPAATTSFTFSGGGIGTVSNTFVGVPGRGFFSRYGAGGLVPTAGFGGEGIGPVRFSLSSTTTVFLNANAIFTVDTNAAYGVLRARRVR